MNLRNRIRYLGLTIAELWATRFLDAVIAIVLIRSLDVNSLGSFLIYQSWVGILLLAFPALENILYREYGKLRDAGKLAHEISVFRKFNWIKISAAIALTLVCAFLPGVDLPWTHRVAALSLAFMLPL